MAATRLGLAGVLWQTLKNFLKKTSDRWVCSNRTAVWSHRVCQKMITSRSIFNSYERTVAGSAVQ